jgi:hypothetical protein
MLKTKGPVFENSENNPRTQGNPTLGSMAWKCVFSQTDGRLVRTNPDRS